MDTVIVMTLTWDAQIIHQSYDVVYNGKADNIKPNAIFSLEERLRVFHQSLPDCLRIKNPTTLTTCVPPHILCLKYVPVTCMWLSFVFY